MMIALTAIFANQNAQMMRFSWERAFMKLTPTAAQNVLAIMTRHNAKKYAQLTAFLLA